MAINEVSKVFDSTRTRDAIRDIWRIPVNERTRKMLLAEWFQEHKRAAPSKEAKRAAYDRLLGRERNRRLRG